ncbi:PH domain-containing protein [Luteipulveratus mongoliensis]|uniref:Low molecular weight protein antigen 6 PH domain-containing protein n=1 Tax=Luteipulveratus mongoliensis TaxID=571913 RepID=A0A0K1JQC3_9MICO|nr:PH domain-containing protein [Luteipulveratus mongoliensis]AKU18927.1 hypothetical protein VV02_14135 [Luteipulveratus mongoliensis]
MSANRDLYAVFRPRKGRIVPLVAAAASLAVFTFVAVTVQGGGHSGWSTPDRVMLIAFGALMAFGLWRFAQVRAVPTPTGLTVHNLIATRQLEWSQVVNVQFGAHSSWAVLELDDTETLAVMAIQRNDGQRALAEAQRLAALVEGRSRPSA